MNIEIEKDQFKTWKLTAAIRVKRFINQDVLEQQ